MRTMMCHLNQIFTSGSEVTMCSIAAVASSISWRCNYGRNKPAYYSSSLKSSFSLDNLGSFSYWSGLTNPAIAIAPLPTKNGFYPFPIYFSSPLQFATVRRGECTGRLVVRASLFGVGAPEVLVIGVVALLVFGPKGLAEVARNLGKTLQSFQPTIRELQQVSREFKSTLEQEIGLNDLSNSIQNISSPTSNYSSNAADKKPASDGNGGSSATAYTSEEYLKITNEQLKALETKNESAQSEGVFSPPQPEKER